MVFLSRVAHGGEQWRAHLSRGGMVDVGHSAAQGGLADGRVLHKVIILIHHGLCPTDEQNRIPVVQLAHLVRGQQLPPCHLVVGGVGTAASLGSFSSRR